MIINKQNTNLQPQSITNIQKIFSVLVVGETLPKPTDVNDENVKYNDVI